MRYSTCGYLVNSRPLCLARSPSVIQRVLQNHKVLPVSTQSWKCSRHYLDIKEDVYRKERIGPTLANQRRDVCRVCSFGSEVEIVCIESYNLTRLRLISLHRDNDNTTSNQPLLY